MAVHELFACIPVKNADATIALFSSATRFMANHPAAFVTSLATAGMWATH